MYYFSQCFRVQKYSSTTCILGLFLSSNFFMCGYSLVIYSRLFYFTLLNGCSEGRQHALLLGTAQGSELMPLGHQHLVWPCPPLGAPSSCEPTVFSMALWEISRTTFTHLIQICDKAGETVCRTKVLLTTTFKRLS